MKKLHSFAFYTLITPAMALASSAVLAQQSSGSQLEEDQSSMQTSMQNTGYMGAAPANGMHASNLIGAEVITTGDEEIGAVSDLIIDQDGQIVGVVVGVGGFLGMGEKDVAIGWDDIQKSGSADELELRIDQSRDSLMSAPEFETESDMQE